MASRQPIVRQVAWISFLPQAAVLTGSILLMVAAEAPGPVVKGALLYLVLAIALRKLIPRAHRRGVKLIRNKAFGAAIPAFEKSLEFFNRHRWLDNYRYLTLLSSSRISYKEMALLNLAYCHGQTGNGERSRHLYEETLAAFPESEMAQAALRMFDSAERAAGQPTDAQTA